MQLIIFNMMSRINKLLCRWVLTSLRLAGIYDRFAKNIGDAHILYDTTQLVALTNHLIRSYVTSAIWLSVVKPRY